MCPIYYDPPWYEFITFAKIVGSLTILLVPPAIGYMLWRICVTNRINPRGNVCVLGLSETSATRSEMYGRPIEWKMLALYACTGWLTFNLGVIAFDTYYYLTGVLSSLID